MILIVVLGARLRFVGEAVTNAAWSPKEFSEEEMRGFSGSLFDVPEFLEALRRSLVV